MESEIEPQMQKRDRMLPVSIILAGVMISGSIIYWAGIQKGPSAGQRAAAEDTLSDIVIREQDVILGDPKAPISFIEYGDYQCPFCARFFSQVEQPLREDYVKTGKVKMAYRNFAFLGPESFAAAEAAECAKDQKQFWAYHDLLYLTELEDGKEHNGNLKRELFIKLAGDLKLDTAAFGECFDSKKYEEQVRNESTEGQSLGVNATPSFFVNGKLVEGALPYQQFQVLLDSLLKEI